MLEKTTIGQMDIKVDAPKEEIINKLVNERNRVEDISFKKAGKH